MTKEQIEAALPGIDARLSDNGGWWWLRKVVWLDGTRYSHGTTMALGAGGEDIERQRMLFDAWEQELATP